MDTPGATGFSCIETSGDVRAPGDKLTFLTSGTSTIVLVDLSTATASTVATLTPQYGGRLRCPVWNPTGEELAFVEEFARGSDTLWALYLLRWDDAGPGTPQELLQSTTEIQFVVMVTP
jgi:Tol biopolymer transport system component